jgi:hypothetical protein
MRVTAFTFISFFWQLNSAFAQPVEKLMLITDKQWYYPGETIWFAVNTFNACGDSLAQISSVAYVELIDTDGQPVIQAKVKIENAQGRGSLSVSDYIASGNYTLVAYTSWMKNFGSGLFVRKPIVIVNPAKPARINTSYSLPDERAETNNAIQLETSKKQFAKREPVQVKFSVGNRARVSVSVYRIDELEKGSEKIYMSQVPNPCNLAHSQRVPFIFERRGHIVSGKVINLRTQSPAPGIRGYLSAVDYPDRLFVATSDSTGTIRFDVGDLAGKTELVLQTDADKQNNYTIELATPFAGNSGSDLEKGKSDVLESNPNVIDDALISAQVQKIFTGINNLPSLRDSVVSKPFYGKPDGFYLMGDYTHFSTVEEILREYVQSVGVQRRGGKSYPVVYDLKTQKPFSQPPLILVNGVPILDGDRFLKMNTDEFYSIGVVAGRFFMGRNIFYGIIDVRLKSSLTEFGGNARIVDYDGMELLTDFVAPDYGSELRRLDRKPDFRNVLYWNPSIETDDSGNGTVEFYTSDLDGKYIIVIQSVSKNGEIKTTGSLIEVN